MLQIKLNKINAEEPVICNCDTQITACRVSYEGNVINLLIEVDKVNVVIKQGYSFNNLLACWKVLKDVDPKTINGAEILQDGNVIYNISEPLNVISYHVNFLEEISTPGETIMLSFLSDGEE